MAGYRRHAFGIIFEAASQRRTGSFMGSAYLKKKARLTEVKSVSRLCIALDLG